MDTNSKNIIVNRMHELHDLIIFGDGSMTEEYTKELLKLGLSLREYELTRAQTRDIG